MDWPDIARAQDGVISRRQLRGLGLSHDSVDRLLADGALCRVARGIFLARGAPSTYRAELWTAVLATGGVLGFATAARLWGVSDVEPERIDVVVPSTAKRAAPAGVRVHRVFVPRSAVRRLAGLPVTTRAWTLLDHLGRLPWPAAARLADRSVQQGWLSVDDITTRLGEYPGRQGNATLRRLADQLADGAAAESERVLHRLLRQAGIRGWVPNYPVRADGRLVAVVDVALVGARVAIEVDGMAHHVDVDRFQRDRQRQNALTALGWTVLRFTWADLTQRPEYVVAAVRAQLARAS